MSSEARTIDRADFATDECVLPSSVVAFSAAGQRYALPVESVEEVQQIVALSEVPNASAGIVGMIDLRGRIIPAVDLRRLLGLPKTEYTLQTPMVVCRAGSQPVALLVDSVEDVLGLPADCFQAPPAMHPLALKMLGVARLDDGLAYVLDAKLLLQPVNGGR
jgi:purine-binding chemotaxis protein CheW